MPIISEGAAYGQTILANDRGLGIGALLKRTLNRTDATHLLFQFFLGMAVCLIDRFGCFSEVMGVAKLMGNFRQSRGGHIANGVLPIRNPALDRHRQRGFHFRNQRCQVGLTFTQRRTSEQNFSRHAVAKDPQHLMADVGAQPIERYNDRGLVSKDLSQARLFGQVEGQQFLIAGKAD